MKNTRFPSHATIQNQSEALSKHPLEYHVNIPEHNLYIFCTFIQKGGTLRSEEYAREFLRKDGN